MDLLVCIAHESLFGFIRKQSIYQYLSPNNEPLKPKADLDPNGLMCWGLVSVRDTRERA